jgi:hypothetical protein
MRAKLPVNERGRVTVWQIEGQRWVSLHPVDAREQLNRGIVALEPTADVEAPAPADVEEVKAEAVPAPGVSHLPSVHLPDLTVKQLEQYVADNGLDVDLSKIHGLKEEKVEAVRKAIEAKHKAEG